MLSKVVPLPASDDIGDLEPITQKSSPAWYGRPSANYQPRVTNLGDIYLRKRWSAVQAATDMFWSSWLKKYVLLFIKKKKWNVKNTHFQAGHLVFIVKTGVSRSTWHLARIIEVKTSSDNTVRVAWVKTHHGVYVRPTATLFLLGEL